MAGRLRTAEEDVRMRDAEILKLRDLVTSLEAEGMRLDSELRSSFTKLHNDKESAINEGRVLLSQLSRRDAEVALQSKQIEKLRATNANLSARQADYKEEIKRLKAEQRHEISDLHENLQEALASRHAKEMELASYTEKCSGLDQERQSLLLQLHQALERANLASQRAEELQGKLQSTAEKRARVSENVAGEMVEHLKRLTCHMKEIETSMDKTALGFPVGVFKKKAVAASLAKLSNKLAHAEAASLDILTHADSLNAPLKPGIQPGKEECGRQVSCGVPGESKESWSDGEHLPNQLEKGSSVKARGMAFTTFQKWVTWKWRWAASATKAERLKNQLMLKSVPTEAKIQIDESQQKGSELYNSGVDNKNLGDVFLKHKLVPLIMMAWRAFSKLSNLERVTDARNESLKKIISALPWWIRRVGERRALERCFFHWQLLALRANRAAIQEQQQTQTIVSSGPILQSKVERNQVPAVVPTAPLPFPVRTIYRDAEAQTAESLRSSEIEVKHEQNLSGTRAIAHRSRPEPKAAPPSVAKSETRSRFSGDAQRMSRNQETKSRINTTSAARPLNGFQTSFREELKELQDVVSREVDSVKQILPQRPRSTFGRLSGAGEVDPTKQALKSVFSVCNNLAQALDEVRAQLFGAESQTRDPTQWTAGGKMKRCSTKQSESQDDCEAGGSAFKGKDSGRQQDLPETIQHYALPIGRVGRYRSPHQKQPREAMAMTAGEGWPHSSGASSKTQLRTPRHPYGNSADQPHYLQEEKNSFYRYRNGRAESQTDRRPLERVRVQRHSARAERDNNHEFRSAEHEFQDQHPYGKPGVKLQHPQAGRDDGIQVRSEGLSKQQLLISDNSRVGGRVANFKTLAGKSDKDGCVYVKRS
ncbi:hypothetical protein MPTK1_1g25940 [Marchantia polymorpha subsp. ruderalis]|uniref:Uncharacterized protein n=2 Tax=Marchantia polymorpha TaxID=3197 RepID=A0AAF6AUC4_MARPO|nr:hypothetical protein MARPO_0002s0282 [Marchantia polymorpha]BBN00045.1 hypothetical protein Mp_1g25940 [Marchantia polymorpha subsp. ruderalis]|eukprot:PTQ49838.1 hypothetical protein MARPO_0002s0282 [Marchantia polymorpha]